MTQRIQITEKYLLIPIRCSKGGEPPLPEEHLIFLRYNGNVVRYFSCCPANWQDCSWVVSYSMEEFMGKTLELSETLPAFRFSAIPAELPVGDAEKLRPRFHLTPRSGWLNDPNGLYWRNGIWHLFYQTNPFALGMGVMHWALAVSCDLVNWRRLGPVLFPDGRGATWSGSAVVDEDNTCGIACNGEPPVCLFYTAAGRDIPEYDGDFTQCLAFGFGEPPVSFSRYPQTLIDHRQAENRDPRVIRCQSENCWLLLMLLAYNQSDETQMRGTISLCRSDDLIHWEELQQIQTLGGACPDFFKLEFEDEPGKYKWVLMNIPHTYLIGDFDGKRFIPEGEPHSYVEHVSHEESQKRFAPASPFNLGEAYPAQTFNHAPGGRRIGVLKLAREFPRAIYNSQLSLPLEFSLRHNRKGEAVLLKRPVRELQALISSAAPASDAVTLWGKAEFSAETNGEFSIRNCRFRWDFRNGTLDCAGHPIRPEVSGKKLEMEFFADTSTLEVFVNDGEFYLPGTFVPDGSPLPPTISHDGNVLLTLHGLFDADIQ